MPNDDQTPVTEEEIARIQEWAPPNSLVGKLLTERAQMREMVKEMQSDLDAVLAAYCPCASGRICRVCDGVERIRKKHDRNEGGQKG